MNQHREPLARSFPFWPLAALFGAVLMAAGPAWTAPEASGDELRLAIVLTRHGVRAPLLSNEAMASFALQPWPAWEVKPGIQTPHGNQLIALMGDYYRARFQSEGALSGDPSVDGPRLYVRADNDQRTIETGRILAKAMVQVGEPDVHALPDGTVDPLFRPVKAHVGNPDAALAAASVLGRMGGDPANLERAYASQLSELKGILFGPAGPGPDSAFSARSIVAPGRKSFLVEFSGPFLAALECTDAFVLEYADGKPLPEVGWGKVDGKVMTDLLSLHELFFNMVERTRYPAQVGASNLASHILDTMEQSATGEIVPGAIGPPGERIVVLVGHDTNIANLGGLFDMDWCVDGTQLDPQLPGGALVLELWKRGGQGGAFFVRTSYVVQTLDQMREATPLSLGNPPARAPIFVPGCSGAGPDYDAPFASFVRQARRVIDPAFITPEP